MKTTHLTHPVSHIGPLLLALTLSACGGGGEPATSASAAVSRLASNVDLPNKLSGGFAEGISADTDTGDLYVGTDNQASTLTGFILKAGSQDSSFSDWVLTSTEGTQGRLVTGTRVRNGVIYACVNQVYQVWALKLADKSVVAKMQLPGRGFCNDLTFDSAGNLFVTSNGSPDIIYKLAAANVPPAPGAQRLDWKTWHTVATTTAALNGLAHHKALGKLLWSQNATTHSSPTSADTTSAQTEITLPADWSVDGMQVTSAGNLLLIAGLSTVQSSQNLGAQLVYLGTGTKGLTQSLTDGTDCTTTVAIVGEDACCPTDKQKALRLAGAGKL